jgi:DNA-binding LytR/AlgR family response regulator
MVSCAICDDNKFFTEMAESLIRASFLETYSAVDLITYTNSEEFLRAVRDGKYFDVIFLDIEMPGDNGFEVAKKIKEKTPGCIIVFLTSHVEYAVDGYELEIFRFIPKDNLESRIKRGVEDIVSRLELQNGSSYVIDKNNEFERIRYKDIKYIKKDGKYACIFCTNGREIRVRKNLVDVKKELEDSDFIIIDRGIIVNFIHISKLSENDLCMDDGERMAVSRSNIKELKRRLAIYWGGKL